MLRVKNTRKLRIYINLNKNKNTKYKKLTAKNSFEMNKNQMNYQKFI